MQIKRNTKKDKFHTMKTGRNQPCPCGSGKKYKYCCLLAIKSPGEQIPLNDESKIISNEDDLVLAYYIVCLIDILGQKGKLASWSELPKNSTLPPSLIDAMKKTVGAVLRFQKTFETFFHEAAKSTIFKEVLMRTMYSAISETS